MTSKSELDNIAKKSRYSWGPNKDTIDYSFQIFSRFITGRKILELGPAEGVMTEHLVHLAKCLTVVDGSKTFCNALRIRYPEIAVYHSLFEAFETKDLFDHILLGHVLEHVANPVRVLEHLKQFLAKNGTILCAVPNSRSLHRQAAVIMGLMDYEERLNEMDCHHGHKRVYNPETFRRDFIKAGLKINVFGGYWIKPLSMKQINDTWTPEMLSAFMQLGERYPDIAAEIYIIASK